jgi:hypothetical protein
MSAWGDASRARALETARVLARAHLVALASLATACSERITVFIEPPPSGSARALVVAVQGEDALNVRAIAIEDGIAPIEVEGANGAALEALVYDDALSALGLAEGALEASETPEQGEALPLPNRVFALIVGGRSVGWTEQTAISDRVAEFRTKSAVSQCASFEAKVVALETAGDVEYAIAVGDDVAVLGTSDGLTYKLDRAGNLRRLTLQPTKQLTAAVRGELGDLWFATREGELLTGSLDPAGETLTVTPVGTSPARGRTQWLSAGVSDEDGLEIFSMTNGGAFERWSRRAFTSIHQFPESMSIELLAGVGWVGPKEGVAVYRSSTYVARWLAGEATFEDTGAIGFLTSIGHIPRLGTVAGTSEGAFYLDVGGRWEQLASSPLSLPVNAIVPYEDGFLYGAPFGNFGQYRPRHGFCEMTQPAPHWIYDIVPVGDGFLLIGRNTTFTQMPVTLLSRVR